MEEDKVPGSVVTLVIGILLAGIGAIISLAGDQGNAPLGQGIEFLGMGLFALAILIEFFSIGSSLRRISRRLDAALSSGTVVPGRYDSPSASSSPGDGLTSS